LALCEAIRSIVVEVEMDYRIHVWMNNQQQWLFKTIRADSDLEALQKAQEKALRANGSINHAHVFKGQKRVNMWNCDG